MKIKIELYVDSAAFEYYPGRELDRILNTVSRKTIRQLMRNKQCSGNHNKEDDLLRDSNGNKVGTLEVLKDEQ